MSNKRKLRSALLAGASTAFIAGAGASAAFAADPLSASTQVTALSNPAVSTVPAVGHKTATSVQQNEEANLAASVTSVHGDVTGDPTGGTQTGTANTVSANTLQANAQSNVATQSVDLSLINATLDDDPEVDVAADGIAALSVQTSAGHSVTSTATDDTLKIDLDGFQSGSAIVQGNTIGAATTVNQVTQTVAGEVPNGYETLADRGTSSLDTAGDFDAQGTVVVSTLQQAGTVDAQSRGSTNEVNLLLTGPDANVVASAPLVDGNAISASTTLNTARNRVSLEAGDAPTFVGSAVVTNAQAAVQSSGSSDANSNLIRAVVEGAVAGDDETPGDVNSLAGSLGVTNNSITSAATGNDATGTTVPGNRILLGDTLSFEGVNTANPGSSIAYHNGDLTQDVAADLAISSTQGNSAVGIPASLTASAVGNAITANVQSIQGATEGGASVNVDDNTVSASVTGNAVSSALASANSATQFAGSVAIANQQTNYNTTQAATVGGDGEDDGNVIAAVTGYSLNSEDGIPGGVTKDSTVSASGNTVSASGYGNSANQSIALDANTLDIGTGAVALTGGTGGSVPDGNASASGGATITNLQSNYAASLAATQTGTQIGVDADSRGNGEDGNIISRSTLTTADNTAEAVAVSNAAGNSLSLASNDVGSGAGIASVQIAGSNSSVEASLDSSRIGAVASTHVEDSTLTATNNLERAIAYGGSVSNALSIDSNALAAAGNGSTVNYDADSDLSFSNGDADHQPSVNAAFGVLSDQSTQANITATAAGSQLGALVEGDVTSSTVANTANAYVAAAYGNDAANSATFELGNLDGLDTIGAIANTQSAGDATSQISASASGGSVILTSIEDDVEASGVSTSGNAVQALAYGNRATGNVLTVTGNNINSTSAKGVTATSTGGDLTLATSATFAVQNAQAAHGSIAATQLDNADPALATTSAGVLTTIGSRDDDTDAVISGDVQNATVTSEGNRLTAAATGNSGVSGVSLTGNQVTASTGVQNFQVTDAAISANIGLAGDDTETTTPFSYIITGTGLTFGDGALLTGTLHIDTSGLSSAQVDALLADGWTPGSGEVTRAAAGYAISALDYATYLDPEATEPGLPGSGGVTTYGRVPNTGGVTIAVARDVSGSTLAVDSNTVAGSVTGNTATNSLAVSGTSIAPVFPNSSSATTLSASADHALSNIQAADGAELTSTVYSTFALDTVEGASIEGSTLSVSGNSQSAKAVANTAANSVSLAGNDISAGSALSSVQGGSTGSVASTSNSEIFAPAAINGSSVSLSDNTNTSLAVYNDVTNTSTVSGTNVDVVGAGGNATLALTAGTPTATAGHVLLNAQSVGGDEDVPTEVTSTASTTLYNEDRTADATAGLTNSSATISGNSTMAEASSNRATNSLALNGSAAQAASAGVVNVQDSGATVTSTATTVAGIALNGDTPAAPAASGSSVAIADNSTTALARGNSASNALNVSAGSNYGALSTTGAGSQFDADGLSTQAQAAVLNAQSNTGTVTATSQNVTYTVALNGGPAVPAVTGSTVGVTGNSVGALAYGNTANNTLTLTALNTGTPTAAVGNYQTNTAAISATATSVSFGASSTAGNVTNSTFGVTGNSVTATAIGNNGVNAIAAR